MSEKQLAEALADHYVRALEEQGLVVPADKRGFDRLLEEGSVRWEIRRQIIGMDSTSNDSQGYIVQKLLQDAIIQYGERRQRSEEIREIAKVADFHRSWFAAQMGLWKSMVAAAHEGRIFTDVELECHRKLVSRRRKDLRAARANVSPEVELAAQAVFDRETLDVHGLLFDRQLEADMDFLVGNMLNARPTLIVGDKGIAKTQVARFACSLFGYQPVVVSVKGDTTTGDLIRRKGERDDAYSGGSLPYAMREGLPLLLDEINFGDQAIIARLHDVLLRRPGDTVYFPELGEQIEVAPGFTVVATANEASYRYRQRQQLDPALRDRFEIIRRTYPDLAVKNPLFDRHPSLTRMANAYAVDEEGVFSRHVDREMLSALVDVAAITQALYALESRRVKSLVGEGFRGREGMHGERAEWDSAEASSPDRPLIEECISPRTLCRAVQNSAAGNLPDRNLDRFLIDNIVRTLDRDGTQRCSGIVRSVALWAGIDLYDAFAREGDGGDDGDGCDGVPEVNSFDE